MEIILSTSPRTCWLDVPFRYFCGKYLLMRQFLAGLLLISSISISLAQTSGSPAVSGASVPRPKLVVGIVVDQMRWDFLYRYYDRYSASGGFKRFLNQGFSCENTLIPYTPTLTACGHTTIYTGSVPSFHGITVNAWYVNLAGTSVYCTVDKNNFSIN